LQNVRAVRRETIKAIRKSTRPQPAVMIFDERIRRIGDGHLPELRSPGFDLHAIKPARRPHPNHALRVGQQNTNLFIQDAAARREDLEHLMAAGSCLWSIRRAYT